MLFNSYTFIFLFLPLVLVATRLARAWFGLSVAIFTVIAASVIFYGWHRPEIVLLLIGSIGVNYWLTGMIRNADEGTRRRWWLAAIAITLNLALLAYFKYTNFFLDNVEMVTNREFRFEDIALPIGISFYTFQQIAYCADTYANKVKTRDFLSYALFIAFFPQLIAGPIVHHSDLTEQFRKPVFGRASLDDILTGIAIFSIGLFKKKIIADGFAAYATPIFVAADGGASVDFAQAWQGALAYTFQIYFDFSGYSDMALGLARMFGIKLPMNFFSPYKSTSIIEFWRRWHITLSHFLRDYLYIPLGGNRKGKLRRWINLALTMLLGGLWHGANWNFVIWGGLHGLYLVLTHAWRGLLPKAAYASEGITGGINKLAGWTFTFFAVVIAWVFFRATTFGGAMNIIKGMFGMGGSTPAVDAQVEAAVEAAAEVTAATAPVDPMFWLYSAVAFTIAVALPNTMEIFSRVRISVEEVEKPSKAFGIVPVIFKPNMLWMIFIGIIAGIAVFYESPTTEFLYWQF